MNRSDRMLWIAAGLSAVSLVFAAASTTISIIAAACPPTSPWFDAAQNEKLASNARFALTPALMSLALALAMTVQIAARRPVLKLRARPVPDVLLVLSSLFVIAFTGLIASNIRFTITEVLIPSKQALTDNMSFGGLGLGLGILALTWTSAGSAFFYRWWSTSQRADMTHAGNIAITIPGH